MPLHPPLEVIEPPVAFGKHDTPPVKVKPGIRYAVPRRRRRYSRLLHLEYLLGSMAGLLILYTMFRIR